MTAENADTKSPRAFRLAARYKTDKKNINSIHKQASRNIC